MLQTHPQSLYAAFDVFPSRKGAGIHIARFARALFDEMRGGVLYTLGNSALPLYQREDDVEIVRFYQPLTNYLQRALAFSQRLARLIDECGETLRLCHFRDPWSGTPLLTRKHNYSTVYEVNSFPSIELPATYKNLKNSTLAKIAAQEQFCLEQSDHIITPSYSLREVVLSRGVSSQKVTVIPNGADIPEPQPRPAEAPTRYLIYVGALQPWQGINTLLQAFVRLVDLTDLRLVICSSNYSRRVKLYEKLVTRLGIQERVVWRFALESQELAAWLSHATLSVAPLTECARNIEQGCAPLKILESLAAGVPVVASDLPSVREIMTDGEHGRLVQADRPGELARVIRVLLQYPERLREMGDNGQRHIAETFSWRCSTQRLTELYRQCTTTFCLRPSMRNIMAMPLGE
jgi:glycosyltransferase involved in cell wall biosynthesis